MTAGQNVVPATTKVNLTFNAGEDITIRLVVRDKLGVPVPLQSAIATIANPDCDPLHQWTTEDGSLELGQDHGVVFLHSTKAQTLAWQAWGDSEWQLDTRDVFGRYKRPVQGDVHVNPTRQDEE